MSGSVIYVIVDILSTKRGKEGTFLESCPFYFLSSECRVRVNYGWDSNERKIRVYVKSHPQLSLNFFCTTFLYKGSNSLSYPKKLIQSPNECIWESFLSHIDNRLPGSDKHNINFRFTFQGELDSSFDQKNTEQKSVQTSLYQNETNSLQRLSDDFGRFLVGDVQYDFELKCGDLIIKVHKDVLRARSRFFENKLQSTTENQIEFPCMDPAAFHEIVRYLYTGKPPDLSFEMAKKIYEAGDICNTGCLKEECVEFLIENLTMENACELLALAEDGYFKEKIVEYVIEKEIPYLDEYWMPFCNNHSKIANEVLNKLLKRMRQRRT